jgi:hypothetical protein
MADIPDFRVQTPAIDPTAFATVLQRRRQIEDQNSQAEQERKDNRLTRILAAVQGGQAIAKNMMDLADKRSQSQGRAALEGIMTSPEPQPPAPMAQSSMAPTSEPFPVAPSTEQVQDYSNAVTDRRKRLLSALVQANPDEVTKQMAQMAFPEASKGVAPSYEAKDILYNGKPMKANYESHTGAYTDPMTGGTLTGDIQPYSPADNTEITDKDRSELMPLAKAIVEGRATPSALTNTRGSRKEKLARLAAEIDPSFDLSMASQRGAIRRDFTTGNSAKALTSLNTVIGHLDTLNAASDALDNTNFPKFNSLENYLKKNTGKADVQKFTAAKNLVDSELGKVAQGSGVVTNEEREQFSRNLGAASSPAQVKGVIATYVDLMKSRTDSLKSNWEQAMPGVSTPIPVLNNHSRVVLKKYGYNPNTMEKEGADAAPSASQPIDALAGILGLKKKAK